MDEINKYENRCQQTLKIMPWKNKRNLWNSALKKWCTMELWKLPVTNSALPESSLNIMLWKDWSEKAPIKIRLKIALKRVFQKGSFEKNSLKKLLWIPALKNRELKETLKKSSYVKSALKMFCKESAKNYSLFFSYVKLK